MAILHDLRYAFRILTKAPAFSAVAIATLALGIGANTAIFSVINAVLLRPLPYRDARRLVWLQADQPGQGFRNVGFSVPELNDLRQRAGVFDEVAAAWSAPGNMTGGEHPERLQIVAVTPNYFTMLGARPELGRLIDQRDYALGFADAVVLSDGVWRRLFGADPNVLGHKLRLDNDLYTIVGVARPDLRHPEPPTARLVEMWVTAGFSADPFPKPSRNARLPLEIIGHLKPHMSVQQAQAQLDSFAASLRRDYAADYPVNAGWKLSVQSLQSVVVGNSRTLLLALLLAVALILLIGCVNVANLLLARASTRQREIGIRMALGASRSRIAWQILTEALVLALIGGATGVLAANAAEYSLVTMLPATVPRAHEIGISSGVLFFALATALLTSVIFGLAPALQAAKADPAAGLGQSSRTGSATGKQSRLRRALVASEVALSLVLLVTAGLLLRTVLHLLGTDPGFNTHNLISASVWLPVPNDPKSDPYATQQQRRLFIRAVEQRLQQAPGVTSAALTSAVPIKTRLGQGGFRVEGQSESDTPVPASLVLVTPDYFRTIDAPLLQGQMLQPSEDEHSPFVVLLDQTAARRFWPQENALGKHIRFTRPIVVNGKRQAPPWMTVVGIVPDVKYRGMEDVGAPHAYLSMYQLSGKLFGVLVRGDRDPAELGRALQREVQAVDANLPVSEIMTMNDVVAASVSERRFSATLVAGFAVLALLLASIGVYGVASYTVAQRTRELGIRVALGATRVELLKQVLRDGMLPVAGGAVLGAIIGLLSSKLLSSLLFGVSFADPVVFLTAVVTLAAVAFLANLLPARRAARVDPMVALRCE